MGTYRGTAELAWRWVLDQVRYDDSGVWIPAFPGGDLGVRHREGMYAGVGGLAHVLAEIRLSREWTAREQELADAVAARVRAGISVTTDATFFNGLVSAISVLTALGAPGSGAAVARLLELSTPDGWPQDFLEPPRYLPGARVHDVAVGTAGAVWARRHDVEGADELARTAADVLLAEREQAEVGANWRWVPERFTTNDWHSPNFSHGVAGVAEWHRRCLHSVFVSGLPERRYPGFWDNDGRCCGTAGVGDMLLGCGQHTDFAFRLADVAVERAIPDGSGVCWRFIEHRDDDPLLPPGIGWMQGAAGIAGFLFHADRVEQGDKRSVPRIDTWWSLSG